MIKSTVALLKHSFIDLSVVLRVRLNKESFQKFYRSDSLLSYSEYLFLGSGEIDRNGGTIALS